MRLTYFTYFISCLACPELVFGNKESHTPVCAEDFGSSRNEVSKKHLIYNVLISYKLRSKNTIL